jgi:hypothetical protein
MGRGQAESARYDKAWSLSCLPRTRYSMSDLSVLLGVLTWRLKGDVSDEGMLIFLFKFRVLCCNRSNDWVLRPKKTGRFWRKTYIFCIVGNHRPIMPVPAAARLLRLWVRIPSGTWMSVSCEWCVLSGRDLCDELITRPEESYRLRCVVVCDLKNLMNEEVLAHWGIVAPKTNRPIKTPSKTSAPHFQSMFCLRTRCMFRLKRCII